MSYLQLSSASFQDVKFPLDEPTDVVIGRDFECEIVLSSGSEHIAPRHARVMAVGSQCIIEPLDDVYLYPVRVNGASITTPHPLRDGDRVLVGAYTIDYIYEQPAPSPSDFTPVSPRVPAPPPPREDVAPGYHGGAVLGRPRGFGEMRFRSDEVPLEDIIPLLANSRATIAIRYAAHPQVAIYMRRGNIYWVSFQDEPDPYIAFARILALDPAEWYGDRQWSGEGVVDEPLDARVEQFFVEVHQRLEKRATRLDGR